MAVRETEFKFPILEQVGGGVNVATLTGTLTLTYLSAPYQVLDPGGATRIVVVPDPSAARIGHRYVIAHSGSADSLTIKQGSASGSTLATIAAGGVYELRSYGSAYAVVNYGADLTADLTAVEGDVATLQSDVTALEALYVPVWVTFPEAAADTIIERVKAPPGGVVKAIRMRGSAVPDGGTIQVERDNDGTTASLLSGGTAINATAITPANDELDCALHATAANLVMTTTSWIKFTSTNLNMPATTDVVSVGVLFGVA